MKPAQYKNLHDQNQGNSKFETIEHKLCQEPGAADGSTSVASGVALLFAVRTLCSGLGRCVSFLLLTQELCLECWARHG